MYFILLTPRIDDLPSVVYGTSVCGQKLSVELLPLVQALCTLFIRTPLLQQPRREADTADELCTLFIRTPLLQEPRREADIADENALARFLTRCALRYSNMGDYLSFGDSNFVSTSTRDKFDKDIGAALGAAHDLSHRVTLCTT